MAQVAIFGLGRSGLGVVRAAVSRGDTATVYDQSLEKDLIKKELPEGARALGAQLVFGWDGILPSPSPGTLLVVNPAVDMRSPLLKRAQEQGYEVVSEIEYAYRISKAPIIAITGTNGKSTTTVMTYLCLRECGVDAILCGNIFGSGYPELSLTEAALIAREDQILVAEVSSFQLEWVSQFKPVAAGITNIWEDHLVRYDSFEQYAATKQRIFAAQDESDFAVIKANDPVVQTPGVGPSARRSRHSKGRLASSESVQSAHPRVLTFGATGEHARVDERFLTVLDKQVKLEDLPFSEPHNFANAAMASLLAFGALAATSHPSIVQAREDAERRRSAKTHAYNRRELDGAKGSDSLPDCIFEGLKRFKPLEHRMEFVGKKNGVQIVNNSMCTNVDAVLKSVTSLRGPNHVLIGGRNKGLDFRPLRHYFSNGMHHAYVFGEARKEIAEQIDTPLVYEKMEDAFRAAIAAVKSGEVVMLAPGCVSSDQFSDFRERGDVFKQLAKEWLES